MFNVTHYNQMGDFFFSFIFCALFRLYAFFFSIFYIYFSSRFSTFSVLDHLYFSVQIFSIFFSSKFSVFFSSRFHVKIESLRDKVDPGTTVKGAEYIDLPAKSKKDYKLSFFAYKEGQTFVKVSLRMFRNAFKLNKDFLILKLHNSHDSSTVFYF